MDPRTSLQMDTRTDAVEGKLAPAIIQNCQLGHTGQGAAGRTPYYDAVFLYNEERRYVGARQNASSGREQLLCSRPQVQGLC